MDKIKLNGNISIQLFLFIFYNLCKAGVILKNIIASVSKKNTERANPDLFDRNSQFKIHEYIVNGMKQMEALPYIKFTNWELITDESKIDIKLNRRHLKNKLIQRDKTIEKIKPIDETACELLIADFVINFDGDVRYIRKRLLIPAYIDNYHLLVNGNDILPDRVTIQ